MAALETVQLIKQIMPVHGICTNKFAVSQFNECYGTCNSGTKYNKVSGTFVKQCDCCTIKELTNIPVEMTCLDNYKYKLDVAVPKECNCAACTEQSQKLQEQQQQQGTKTGQQQQFTKTKGKY